MDVARLNFSHGDYRFHADTIARIRRIARRLGRNVAILQDIQGPKIRVGWIEHDQVRLQTGRRVTLTSASIVGNAARIPVDFRSLARIVRKGDRIMMGDGEIELEAVRVGREVECRVVAGGGGDVRSRACCTGFDDSRFLHDWNLSGNCLAMPFASASASV